MRQFIMTCIALAIALFVVAILVPPSDARIGSVGPETPTIVRYVSDVPKEAIEDEFSTFDPPMRCQQSRSWQLHLPERAFWIDRYTKTNKNGVPVYYARGMVSKNKRDATWEMTHPGGRWESFDSRKIIEQLPTTVYYAWYSRDPCY